MKLDTMSNFRERDKLLATSNLAFSVASATKYLSLFRERDKWLPSSHLGINDAYRLLSASGEP